MAGGLQEGFLRDGFIFPVDVFTAEEVVTLRREFGDYLKREEQVQGIQDDP